MSDQAAGEVPVTRFRWALMLTAQGTGRNTQMRHHRLSTQRRKRHKNRQSRIRTAVLFQNRDHQQREPRRALQLLDPY
jgi:hypothetical protein